MAAAAVLLILPSPGLAAPPVNDHYFESLRLNDPGSRLERRATLRDLRDTSEATVQEDLLDPGPGGGGPEPTECGDSSFGNTVWYDFHPDLNGLVRLRAIGYDAAIAVMPFSRRTFRPALGRRECVDESTSASEELLVRVRRRRAYTIQIGGVSGGGSLELLFDFLADRDADGVLDSNDRCPRLPGRGRGGCPPRLRADATLRARPTASGIQVLSLRVAATRRSRVTVACTRRACRRGRRRVRRRAVRFGHLSGQSLPAGSRLVIRVNRRRAIGRFIVYRITRGNFRKVERCLRPGSRKPRRRCR